MPVARVFAGALVHAIDVLVGFSECSFRERAVAPGASRNQMPRKSNRNLPTAWAAMPGGSGDQCPADTFPVL